MQLPKFRFHRTPRCTLLIYCGVSLLLLFFFSWRAMLAIAGVLLIAVGCGNTKRR